MIRDHERFSKIVGGIQSLVVCVAIVTGGIWTLYTFSSLNLLQKARADLDKTRAELRDTLEKQPVVEVTTTCRQVRGNRGSYYIAVDVKLVNRGGRSTLIQWARAVPLALRRINTDDDEKDQEPPIFAKPLSIGSTPASQYAILSGGSVRLPFLVRVHRPGVYYVEFQAEVTAIDPKAQTSDKPIVAGGVPLVWTDATIAIVQ